MMQEQPRRGNGRERSQEEAWEEADQCPAEWKASNTLLLTGPKHSEACFHREQLVCRPHELSEHWPPPSPLPPPEQLDNTFIG